MKTGDKVKTIYGTIETVLKVEDCRVFTKESLNSWYHPSKVWLIEEQKGKTETEGGRE